MTKLKPLLLPLLLGIVTLLFMVMFMTQVSIDFRIVLLISTVLLFGAGLWSAKKEAKNYLITLIIITPYSAVFGILLYPQIPQLLSFIPFFFIATYAGVYFRRETNVSKYYFSLSFALLTLLMAIVIVPRLLDEQLSTLKNEEVTPFTIVDMEGNKIETKDLNDKILVLDFFGTWCKPCVQELKELDKIYNHFQGSDDVVFFVINSAEGGDTIEKMNKFIQKNNYPFHFAFDQEQQLVNKFNLKGVPYLFVFDKSGNMRYQHYGYNAGETHFDKVIIDVIESLK